MNTDDVQKIVQEVLKAQQQPIASDEPDLAMLRTVAAVLQSFGIDKDEHRETMEDLRYLRRWREGAQRISSIGLTAFVMALVGGIASALWIGFKAMVGK